MQTLAKTDRQKDRSDRQTDKIDGQTNRHRDRQT